MKTTKIVIAGGGFAGLYAAMHFDKRLARQADIEVTLISRENFILFTPLLHEVAAGDLYPGDIVNPLRRILRHVKFIDADVQAIDLNARRIRCIASVADRELEFEFDHLLLTLGSETNFFNMQLESRGRYDPVVRFDHACPDSVDSISSGRLIRRSPCISPRTYVFSAKARM